MGIFQPTLGFGKSWPAKARFQAPDWTAPGKALLGLLPASARLPSSLMQAATRSGKYCSRQQANPMVPKTKSIDLLAGPHQTSPEGNKVHTNWPIEFARYWTASA